MEITHLILSLRCWLASAVRILPLLFLRGGYDRFVPFLRAPKDDAGQVNVIHACQVKGDLQAVCLGVSRLWPVCGCRGLDIIRIFLRSTNPGI